VPNFLSVVVLLLGLSVTNTYAGLPEDLQDGHHVLLMRHADAPGFGDPPGYKLEDCSTQRNLGEGGRKQAVAIGRWLELQGVTQAKVLSSAWCRCLDTARLIDKGAVSVEPALGSFFDDMSLGQAQTKDMQKMIATRFAENKSTPLILVTHHVNIEAYTGKIVNVGDMVLVRVRPDGSYVSHQVYPSPKANS
jgi:phosphohistidine phosphatase SixA